MRQAVPLVDREGWLAAAQARVNAPYPDALRRAIVAYNWPLLRTSHASYRHQLDLAVQRADVVSINHRLAAFLASVFDIAYALHRTWHPGEKRQIVHLAQLKADTSPALAPVITALLRAAPADLMAALDAVCDVIDAQVYARMRQRHA
jgi:hypothetical protein